MRLVVTRPDPDARPLIEALEKAGHEVLHAPLMEIVFRPDVKIASKDYQAVLVTSANGARALAAHPGLVCLEKALAVTVGPASTRAARDAGFSRIEQADGDVAALIDFAKANLSPQDGPLLYASGAKTTGSLQARLTAAGFEVDRAILYDAVAATALPSAIADFMQTQQQSGVLLFSPRTARIWRELAAQAGLKEVKPCYFCLSHNVARVLGDEDHVRVCVTPDMESMLDLVAAAT